MKYILILLALSASVQAQTIWFGDSIKLLKKNLTFKDSNLRIVTGDTDDPTSVAKSAPQGSLYVRSGTGVLYQKQDSGSSTNWNIILTGGSLPWSLTNGGTNKSLTAVNGGLVYTDANSMEISAAGTSGQAVLSGGAGAPTFFSSSGVVKATSGVLSASAVDLASADVTGLLPMANGGTNKNAVASNGSIVYSDANSFELSTVGTSGQPLLSGGAGAPSWFSSSGVVKATSGVLSTANVSLTTEVTGVLPIANGGTNKGLTLAAGAVAWTDADSFEVSAAGTTGQALISGGTGSPTWFAPTATRCAFYGASGVLAEDSGCTFTAASDTLTVGAINATSTTVGSKPCNPQTTAQRTTLGGGLGSSDDGTCVFDTDENVGYDWNGSMWVPRTGSAGQYWAGTLSGADISLGTTADAGTWNQAANASLTTFATEKSTGGISCSAIGSGNAGVTCTNVTAGLKKVCFGGIRSATGTSVEQSFRVASCDGSSVCSTTTANYSETWSDVSAVAGIRSGPNHVCRTIEYSTSGTKTFNLQEMTDTATVVASNTILASSVNRKLYMSIEDAAPMAGATGGIKICSFAFSGATNRNTVCSGTCTIRAELNECVSSVTRNSSGNYTINWQTSPANYWTGAETYNCALTVVNYNTNGCFATSTNGLQTQTTMNVTCLQKDTGVEDASIVVYCTGY